MTDKSPLLSVIFALCIWLSAANQSPGESSATAKIMANQCFPAPSKLRSISAPMPTFVAPKVAPSEIATGPSSFAPPSLHFAAQVDYPFLIEKSFDCSDINLLKAQLKKVVASIGMSVVVEGPAAFSESLPDKPGSRDGDLVQVNMSWSVDQPGKRIDVSVLYERVIWVQGDTYGPRPVKPEQAGRDRFEKLKAEVGNLKLPTAVVATSPTPTESSARLTPTP